MRDFDLQRFNVTPDRFSQKMVDNLTGLVVGAPYLGKQEREPLPPLVNLRLLTKCFSMCHIGLLADCPA